MARITRRKLFKLSAAGAVAAQTGGLAAILATGRAIEKTLAASGAWRPVTRQPLLLQIAAAVWSETAYSRPAMRPGVSGWAARS